MNKRENYSWYERFFFDSGSKEMGIYLKNPRHPLNEEFYLAGEGEI